MRKQRVAFKKKGGVEGNNTQKEQGEPHTSKAAPPARGKGSTQHHTLWRTREKHRTTQEKQEGKQHPSQVSETMTTPKPKDPKTKRTGNTNTNSGSNKPKNQRHQRLGVRRRGIHCISRNKKIKAAPSKDRRKLSEGENAQPTRPKGGGAGC